MSKLRDVEQLKRFAQDVAPVSGTSPFDLDTDAGVTKIIKREGKTMTSAEIARKYNFSLSFVKEVLGGDNPRPGDVAPVGDAGKINVSYKLNGPTAFQVDTSQFIEWARKNKRETFNFATRLAALKEFTGDPRLKDWETE